MTLETKGLFIVFEGIDGTGKSTMSRKLAEHLQSQGLRTIHTREPRTDNEFGRKLRDTTRTPGMRLDPEEEVDLFIEDRKLHLATLVNPSINDGYIVISDRYFYSNVAYQGSRGLRWQGILARNKEFARVPDLVVLLDCIPQVSLSRKDDKPFDDFEKTDSLSVVRAIYLEVAKLESEQDHFAIIDAGKSPEEVWQAILDLVSVLLDETGEP